mgnify:CR=1 FL=1
MNPITLVNGVLQGQLSVFDRAVQYGDGVFRTFAYRGSLIDWDLHDAKLRSDAQRLRIAAPPKAQWEADIATALSVWDAPTAAIKLVLSRGESARGYLQPQGMPPTRIVYISELSHYPEDWRQHGITLFDCKTPCALQPALAGVKHLNRLENVLARLEWQDNPAYQEGLMYNSQGFLISGVMSNVFMRQGARIFTPDLRLSGIAGVTRQKIIQYYAGQGVPVQEIDILPQQFLQADEAWLCNSLMGVLPIKHYKGQNWSSFISAQALHHLFRESSC